MTNLFSKQSLWVHAVAAGAVALLFTACGDEVTEVTEVTQVVGMQVVEAGDALPKCTADNEGAMVYSVDSAAAYTCIGKKWTSMKGKDGADGKDGKDGADGKNGKDGKNGTSESSSCTAKALKNGKGYKIVCGGDSVGVVLNGEDGAKGDTGVAGTSCSAKKVSDGVKITCTDGKSFTLSNGADGSDGKSFVDGWMVDPRDKQLYRVVTIGEQTWMAENLNYATAEGSYCYDQTESDPKTENCTKYGRLYTWAAAVGKSEEECGYGFTCGLSGMVRGVCPEGWHLPDTTEWNTLFTAVGGIDSAGKILKSQTGWKYFDEIGNGTDAYGFSVFPAGLRINEGNFDGEGSDAFFWSATESNSYDAYYRGLYCSYESASLYGDDKSYAFSVRCLKD